ncbi:MAG: hypothetical protein FJY09_00730 [Chlorobi bacterium]|nr:hypothetical protein [Chlorobiota bacterium]
MFYRELFFALLGIDISAFDNKAQMFFSSDHQTLSNGGSVHDEDVVKTQNSLKNNMGESIMKKTMITALVAVAAIGFSSTSFARGGSSSSSSGLIDIEDVSVGVDASKTITKTTTVDINKTINKWGVEADFKAPAAGGNIGPVAYEAPAVAGDLIEISAKAIAIQRGEVAPVYADLAFMGSGGAMARSGEAAAAASAAASASSDAAAAAGLAASSAAAADAAAAGAAAGGDSGYVSFSGITTGAVSTGAVTIDLSNAATALAVGGSYAPPAVTP